ncbi:MAG: hypothetical protein ACR2PG_04800 [Hyphomicrobiaceae bacterium]
MSERIAALIPGVTPRQVQLYQPALLPVSISLAGNLLVAFGLSGMARAPRIIDVTAVEPHPVAVALRAQRRPATNKKVARCSASPSRQHID